MKLLYFLLAITLFIFFFVFRRTLFRLPIILFYFIRDCLKTDRDYFKPYGCWFFVGKQGAGKTMSLVYTLEHLRKEYPKLKIYTNFGYVYETKPLIKMTDLLDRSLYNGTYGTVFVIDEIQNEFSASTSRDFPESVLSLVTQQRKNHVLILCTSQVFTRVSKPLREQAFRVIECSTYFGRYTTCRYYDGIDYVDSVDKSESYKTDHRHRIDYNCFIQTDKLRGLYDSYKLIDRLSRVGFVPKYPVADNINKTVNVSDSGKRSARPRARASGSDT